MYLRHSCSSFLSVLTCSALCLQLSALAVPTHVAAAPPSDPSADAKVATLRQVAGVLDYIAGDYRGAVGPDGKVLDESEYTEQRSFADEAHSLLNRVGVSADDPVQQHLRVLSAALAARKAPAEVEQLCQQTRAAIVSTHHVDLTPNTPPSRTLGEQLYRAQGCTTCHGADGSAQTEPARALDPRPANFLDPERVATVSPHRAFHAISFGVPGTAMTAYPQLNAQERWSLAFYVLSLRHTHSDLADGKRAIAQLTMPPPIDARGLSELTEEQLLHTLGVISDPKSRDNALAYLRAEAPFAADADTEGAAQGSMAEAFAQLARGIRAYRDGDHDEARRAFISAYLDGVEPHEAGLRARDPQLVSELERSMLALRSTAAQNLPPERVEAEVQKVRELLSRAEHGQTDGSAAFFGAFTIALREGLEIVLLITALLGLVRKRGQTELAKWVHAGWLTAVPAGIATYVAAESALKGVQRELAEGIAALLAAVVLLGVTHWLIGQLSSKRWVDFLAKRVGEAVSSARAAWGIFALSFVAAYREAFEIVLFFQALARDAGSGRQVLFGALAGLGLLSVVSLVLLRAGQRLKPGPFMLASSVLLALLAFVLVGKGVHALQEAAVVPLTHVSVPDVEWFGIYGSVESLVAQGLLLLALVGSAVWPRIAGKRTEQTSSKVAAE